MGLAATVLASSWCTASTPAASVERRIGVTVILVVFVLAVLWGDLVVLPVLSRALAASTTICVVITGHTGVVVALRSLWFSLRVELAANARHHPSIELSPCLVCGVRRPKGSHHCRTCNVCTCDFDHHCGVLGTCIARGNHDAFIRLLLSGGASLMFVAACGVIAAKHECSRMASPAACLSSSRFLLRYVVPMINFGGISLALTSFGLMSATIHHVLGLTMSTATPSAALHACARLRSVQLLQRAPCSCVARLLELVHLVGDFGVSQQRDNSDDEAVALRGGGYGDAVDATLPSMVYSSVGKWWASHPNWRVRILGLIPASHIAYAAIRLGYSASCFALVACALIASAAMYRLNFGKPPLPPMVAVAEEAVQTSRRKDAAASARAAECAEASGAAELETAEEAAAAVRPPMAVLTGCDDPRYCAVCRWQRPELASHCDICRVCVRGRDHHCGLFGCCIGSHNRTTFCVLLLSSAIGNVITTVDVYAFVSKERLPAAWAMLRTPWVDWNASSTFNLLVNVGVSVVLVEACVALAFVITIVLLQQLAFIAYASGVEGRWASQLYKACGRPMWGTRGERRSAASAFGEAQAQEEDEECLELLRPPER